MIFVTLAKNRLLKQIKNRKSGTIQYDFFLEVAMILLK